MCANEVPSLTCPGFLLYHKTRLQFWFAIGDSGREALTLIANGPKIDLVLADCAMPEMTGIELAETIYTTYQLVTGYGNREAL